MLADAQRRAEVAIGADGQIARTLARTLARGLPDHDVRVRSMLSAEGLEMPCVVWPTSAPAPLDETPLEWIYMMMTRTTRLLVIVADPSNTDIDAARAESLIARSGRLNVWDQDAADALAAIVDQAGSIAGDVVVCGRDRHSPLAGGR